MDLSNLIQVTAVSAILLGPLSIIGSLLTEDIEKKYPALEWLFFSNNIFMLLAFLGIYLIQIDGSGFWGLAAFLLALLGTMFSNYPEKLFGMDSWEFAGILIALASIFIAIASFITGVFPLWVPGFLVAGIVLGIPSMFVEAYRRTGFIIGGIGFGLGMTTAGYFMLTM